MFFRPEVSTAGDAGGRKKYGPRRWRPRAGPPGQSVAAQRRVGGGGVCGGCPGCGHPSIGAAPSKRVPGSRVCPEGVGRQAALDAGGGVKILGRRGMAAEGDWPTDMARYGRCLHFSYRYRTRSWRSGRDRDGPPSLSPHLLRVVVLVLVDGHELVDRLASPTSLCRAGCRRAAEPSVRSFAVRRRRTGPQWRAQPAGRLSGRPSCARPNERPG